MCGLQNKPSASGLDGPTAQVPHWLCFPYQENLSSPGFLPQLHPCPWAEAGHKGKGHDVPTVIQQVSGKHKVRAVFYPRHPDFQSNPQRINICGKLSLKRACLQKFLLYENLRSNILHSVQEDLLGHSVFGEAGLVFTVLLRYYAQTIFTSHKFSVVSLQDIPVFLFENSNLPFGLDASPLEFYVFNHACIHFHSWMFLLFKYFHSFITSFLLSYYLGIPQIIK